VATLVKDRNFECYFISCAGVCLLWCSFVKHCSIWDRTLCSITFLPVQILCRRHMCINSNSYAPVGMFVISWNEQQKQQASIFKAYLIIHDFWRLLPIHHCSSEIPTCPKQILTIQETGGWVPTKAMMSDFPPRSVFYSIVEHSHFSVFP